MKHLQKFENYDDSDRGEKYKYGDFTFGYGKDFDKLYQDLDEKGTEYKRQQRELVNINKKLIPSFKLAIASNNKEEIRKVIDFFPKGKGRFFQQLTWLFMQIHKIDNGKEGTETITNFKAENIKNDCDTVIEEMRPIQDNQEELYEECIKLRDKAMKITDVDQIITIMEVMDKIPNSYIFYDYAGKILGH